jgi:hypothetical protein
LHIPPGKASSTSLELLRFIRTARRSLKSLGDYPIEQSPSPALRD